VRWKLINDIILSTHAQHHRLQPAHGQCSTQHRLCTRAVINTAQAVHTGSTRAVINTAQAVYEYGVLNMCQGWLLALLFRGRAGTSFGFAWQHASESRTQPSAADDHHVQLPDVRRHTQPYTCSHTHTHTYSTFQARGTCTLAASPPRTHTLKPAQAAPVALLSSWCMPLLYCI